MDQPQTNDPVENLFGADVLAVLASMPRPIRTYIQEERYSAVAQSLTSKYQLHLDQGLLLEQELILLLLGIDSPQVFLDALTREGSIPQETTELIMKDINEMVFMPLQQQIRGARQEPESPPKTPPPPAPRYGAPPVQRPPQSPPPQRPMQPAMQQRPPGAPARPMPPPPANLPGTTAPPRAPGIGERSLSDREVPHMDLGQAIRRATPLQPAATATPPTQTMQPATSLPPRPSAPPQAPPPPKPSGAEYTIDPYREPLGEN